MKILVVEDNAPNAELVMDLLQRWGFDAKSVNTAGAALESIRGEAFDLLLLDMVLPDRPGYELIPQIKKMRPKTIIAVMTGQDDPQLERKVRDLGVSYYLHKPFFPKDLEAVLKKIVSSSH